MSAKAFTAADAASANLVLIGEDKGRQAVHDLITAYRANRRSGTAHTKTRGEVSGNNKKIYKQKGTGNARHGDKRAPIFVGGGVVFGPRHRSYAKSVPKSVRKLALRRVLGDLTRATTPNWPLAMPLGLSWLLQPTLTLSNCSSLKSSSWWVMLSQPSPSALFNPLTIEILRP